MLRDTFAVFAAPPSLSLYDSPRNIPQSEEEEEEGIFKWPDTVNASRRRHMFLLAPRGDPSRVQKICTSKFCFASNSQ